MINKKIGFEARKSLGQNFLQDDNLALKIARAINPLKTDCIVEIGPGFGALTQFLVGSGCRYTGIEIDERLVPVLRKTYRDTPDCSIVHADFRKTDLAALVADSARIRLVGNIPYHITSSIIFKAFEQAALMKDMILMVQKEVGERIVAAPRTKQYGILSVVSQTFANVTLLFPVSPHVFWPKPDVQSAVVKWDFSRQPEIRPLDISFYLKTVKTAFNKRRKTLRNSLKELCAIDTFIEETGLDLKRRPEELTVDDFVALSNALLQFLNKG